MTRFRLGDTPRVKWTGEPPLNGRQVEVITRPDADGMVKVRLVIESWISVDDLMED